MTHPAGFRKSDDPTTNMAQHLRALEETVRSLATPSAGARIPVLAEDPPETDPANLWMMPDGRLRGRHLNPAGTAFVYREWVSTTPGSGTSATAPAAPPPAPVSQVATWGATWSQSYRQAGPARTDSGVKYIYYGSSGDGFNGQNRSLIGFDYATIATTLTGSTITAVYLTITNIHAYWESGAEPHFGIHNFTSEPASWAGGGIPRPLAVKHLFKRNTKRTVALPLDFAIAIRDGWGKGIAVEAPNSNRNFYGYAAGVGSGIDPPALTVNYDK